MRKAQRLIEKLRGRYHSQSFWRLVRLGERAVPDLRDALKWPNPQTRKRVIRVLNCIGTGPALASIEQCLLDTDEDVQVVAVQELRGAKACANGIKVLFKSDSTELRAMACFSMGMMGCTETLPDILGLADDPSVWIRSSVLYSIGELGSSDFVNLVKSHVIAEDYRERSEALHAMRCLDEAAALPVLIDSLYDTEKRIRTQVLVWFEEHPDKRAVPALKYVFENDYLDQAELAAKIIQEIDGQCVTEAGQIGVQAQPPFVEETYPRAYVQLQQTDRRLTELKAVFRRSKTLTTAQLDFLSECLTNYDDSIRVRSVLMLRDARSPEAQALILRCLIDVCPSVRSVAISAFDGIEHSEHRSALETLKSDSNDRVRSSAITALSHLTYPEGLRDLIDHSRDGFWVFRNYATIALGTFGDRDSIERLHELTTDSHQWVRQAAADALGNVGGSESLPYLMRLRGNDFRDVNNAAKRAIRKINQRNRAAS